MTPRIANYGNMVGDIFLCEERDCEKTCRHVFGFDGFFKFFGLLVF